MATAKRARATSSGTRSKKSATVSTQETTTQQTPLTNVQEVIRQRAYQLFEQRGRMHGYALEDWLRAETEVQTQSSQSA